MTSFIILLIIFIVSIISAVILLGMWTYHDAKSRGLNAPLWTIIVLLGQNFIGLILYLLVGRKEAKIRCYICNATIHINSKYCNNCGNTVKAIAIPKNPKIKKIIISLIVCAIIFVVSFIGFLSTVILSDNLPILSGVSIGLVQNNWGNKWDLTFKTSGDELKKTITINKSEPNMLYIKGSCEEGTLTLYIIKETIIDAFDMTAQTEEIAIDLSKYGEGKIELKLINNKAKNAMFKSHWE
ncbi:MAG: hypothetical protein K0S55_219 [Clostridia bacterium]|nr:hypothetical protein [Clostridia bacterium]